MEGRRFSVAVVVGVLLGLTVITASSMSSGLYGSFTAAIAPRAPYQTGSSSTQMTTTLSATTTGAGVAQVTGERTANSSQSGTAFSAPLFSLFGGTNSPSHIKNIQAQSAPLTGFVLLPVLVAVILGMILYRVSKVREEEEEPGAP